MFRIEHNRSTLQLLDVFGHVDEDTVLVRTKGNVRFLEYVAQLLDLLGNLVTALLLAQVSFVPSAFALGHEQ